MEPKEIKTPEEFADICPIDDKDFKQRMATMVEDPGFKYFVEFIMPGINYDEYKKGLLQLDNKRDFQLKYACQYLEQVEAGTTSGITSGGTENLDANNPYTAVAASPWGSAGILPITYGYIRMMGADGLAEATKTAILSANYLTKRLEKAYGIVYTGATGRVGHEMILDFRHLKAYAKVDESDVAKRMMDFGFHAPTLSFPVHGTLMVEPTESEPLAELDRFIDMMMVIRQEIEEIHTGAADQEDNVLVNAPHADYMVVTDEWNHKYSREKAAFPLPWVKENKFWITVGRVDNGFGDRNLVCNCL